MGGPLSSLLADLVIENKIEAKIANHPIWKSKVDWIRKADDTFMTWTGSMEELQQFHHYLNTIHPTIKWSEPQVEENGQMPYLDVLIIRSGNEVQTTVYRKPTASDRYTHFSSAQAWREKVITISTLRQRAEEYCSTPQLKSQELDHLFTTFISNAYPSNIVQRYLYDHKPSTLSTAEETKPTNNTFYAPYHPLANKLFRTLQQKFEISPIYKKTQTLSDILYHNRPQQPPIETPGAVYAFPCQEECPKYYIGETRRPTSIRIKEEQRDLRTARIQPDKKFSDENDFGYVQHFKETGHHLLFKNTKVLTLEQHNYRRKLLEGIYIQQNEGRLCNAKAGTSIDKSWLPLLSIGPKYKLTEGQEKKDHS
jgi:hypothetical protein